MKKFHNRKGGFTLIELMIVVAIIGILAAIAIPNFLRFQLKAKSSEGKTNLAAIRTAEESYYSEFGEYVSAIASPAVIKFNKKTAFVNEDGDNEGFDRLGWSPEGYVFFNYVVETGVSGSQFTATAAADIDNDGTGQTWGYRKGSVDGGAHGNSLTDCDITKLTPETVGACLGSYGQSVF
jgi:type IV pilus assembly protein PilA